MISMLFPRSPLCTAAIVFYTCVCIPLGRLKKNGGDAEAHDDEDYHLTGVMFGDKEKEDEEEISCPICLVEFEAEDAVTHLPRCTHLFHIHCIEHWLLRGHLTCPLCRSFVLGSAPPTCSVNKAPTSSTFYLSLFFFCLFLNLLGHLL
ncbi:RING-H2 finger protein ATL18 [Cardamine amara subsp. amara]|uniref:RING-H2 finger protein ATL18 n=1 Tax=Cardamine amara subsp. amara TaxID=228776 RepID=A0ABD0Z635_CARAN